jgi:hypothetical protein
MITFITKSYKGEYLFKGTPVRFAASANPGDFVVDFDSDAVPVAPGEPQGGIMLVVTKRPVLGPKMAQVGNVTVYFRSQESGLKSLPVEFLVIGPGVPYYHALLAKERTRGQRNPIIVELQ